MIMYKQLLAGVVGMSLMWSGCTDSSSSGAIVPVAAGSNSPVQYHYDAIGRLVEAVSPDEPTRRDRGPRWVEARC